ncbi:MAG: hypothetical protein PHS07_00010 [Patescibacteria group bacterium]|nr:hypothetical protein [Patescibacteria group bacterium]
MISYLEAIVFGVVAVAMFSVLLRIKEQISNVSIQSFLDTLMWLVGLPLFLAFCYTFYVLDSMNLGIMVFVVGFMLTFIIQFIIGMAIGGVTGGLPFYLVNKIKVKFRHFKIGMG